MVRGSLIWLKWLQENMDLLKRSKMSNEKKTSSRRKRCAEEQTNADPSIATEPRRLTATKSRVADLFTTAAVPGRSATPDVFVASPNAAAARGDAVQATFDQKLSDYRHEIPDLRNLGMHYRPLGQLTGDHTPVVTRTLQYAADIASSRNGQQLSAKSHSLTCRSACGNRKNPRQRPAPQRTVVAHSVESSAI